MYFDEKMEYCHVYTLGLETDIVFRDKEDFCMGMNAIAVLHSKSTMSILAFVLMSNHFHFILHASAQLTSPTHRQSLSASFAATHHVTHCTGSHDCLHHLSCSFELLEKLVDFRE